MIMKDYKADEGLQGNDKIEKAIAGLQKETTQEMLAAYTYRYPQTHERCWSAYHCCRTAQW